MLPCRLYGWTEDAGPPEDSAAALASGDDAQGPREGFLVPLAEATSCSTHQSSSWGLHGGAACGTAPSSPSGGRGGAAGHGPELPLRLRVRPLGALGGDGVVVVGDGGRGLIMQALIEEVREGVL